VRDDSNVLGQSVRLDVGEFRARPSLSETTMSTGFSWLWKHLSALACVSLLLPVTVQAQVQTVPSRGAGQAILLVLLSGVAGLVVGIFIGRGGSDRMRTKVVDDDEQSHRATEVSHKIATFTSETGVKVTERAEAMIGALLEAVISDPHPRWEAGPDRYRGVYREALDRIPTFLNDIRAHGFGGDVITTFDVAHRTTPIVEAFCPIQKFGQRTTR